MLTWPRLSRHSAGNGYTLWRYILSSSTMRHYGYVSEIVSNPTEQILLPLVISHLPGQDTLDVEKQDVNTTRLI